MGYNVLFPGQVFKLPDLPPPLPDSRKQADTHPLCWWWWGV